MIKFILLCILSGASLTTFLLSEVEDGNASISTLPKLSDHNLKVERIFPGLEHPTGLAFIAPNDVLVLEKDTGKIKRVLNSSIKGDILDVAVATERERGLLGITVTNGKPEDTKTKYVYIYFTHSKNNYDSIDECLPPEPYHCFMDKEPTGNHIYRYKLWENRLIDGKLLLDLPANPGPNHNGGKVLIGPNDLLYASIGDLLPYYEKDVSTNTININSTLEPDGRAGILRITPEGNPVRDGVLGKKYPLNLYYAYGIRNSFGIDFDPLTGNLWDTENGPAYGDEINLVKPGFNSGWAKVQGIWKPKGIESSDSILDLLPGDIYTPRLEPLTNFGDKGIYSSPEFTWNETVGVTALKFLNSHKLGKEYENDMFVGDIKHGRLYHFDLNKERTELVLPSKLHDKIADTDKEIDESKILFGEGFGGITDIQVSPYDGYLYILSYRDGTLYRVVPFKETRTDN